MATSPPTADPRSQSSGWDRAIGIFGWYGVFALLAGYGLSSLAILEPGYAYHLLNWSGATGVCLAAYRKRSYQAAFLEFVWALVALLAIARLSF